jgi:hypothetical protein
MLKRKPGSQYKVSVFCVGIKRRCRREERHNFTLGYFPLGADKEAIRELAKALLLREMRTLYSGALPGTVKPYMILNYVTVEESGTGFTVEKWQPFDEKNLRFDLDLKISA